MANDYDIGNLALQLLGESTRITSLSQQIKSARAINNCYAFLRQAELRANVWKFAIERGQIVSDLTPPNFGRANRFAVSGLSSFLRLAPKYPEDNNTFRDWLIEGSYITSNQNDGTRALSAVRVATAAAGTLATSFANGQTVDGVVLATGDRILIKDQVSGADNGIYTVNSAGAPTRATDFDSAVEVLFGSFVTATLGTANAGKTFILSTNDPITLGTTAQTWVQCGAQPASLNVRFVKDVTNVDLMDPMFQLALAAKIAFQVCEEITNSNAKQQLAEKRYKEAVMGARRVNAIEKPGVKPGVDSWLTVRNNGLDPTQYYFS